jgi:hypothetical protein
MIGWKRIVAVGALLGLTGCVPVYSLHPFFLEGDIVFEPALLGRWLDEDGEWWTMRKSGEDCYELFITPPFSEVEAYPSMELTLFRLDGRYFIDFYPDQEGDCKDSAEVCIAVLYPSIPAHVVAQVGLEGNTLSLGFLDNEWVTARIRAGSLDIRHEKTEDAGSLLTASTRELRNLLQQAVEDEDAFEAVEIILQR